MNIQALVKGFVRGRGGRVLVEAVGGQRMGRSTFGYLVSNASRPMLGGLAADHGDASGGRSASGSAKKQAAVAAVAGKE